MSRLYMLDTNTVSYIVSGKSPASRARLANLPPGELACISVITEAEFHYGLAEESKRYVASIGSSRLPGQNSNPGLGERGGTSLWRTSSETGAGGEAAWQSGYVDCCSCNFGRRNPCDKRQGFP